MENWPVAAIVRRRRAKDNAAHGSNGPQRLLIVTPQPTNSHPQPVGVGVTVRILRNWPVAAIVRRGHAKDRVNHNAHGSNGLQRLLTVTPQRTNSHPQPVGVGVTVEILRNWSVAATVRRRHAKDRVTTTATQQQW